MASGAGLTVRRLVAGRGAWPRVAAYNGAMGCPKRGRVLEASRPALRACNRQFYGEVRVLGSQMGLPRFNLRQVSEDPAWDAARTEPEFKGAARPFRAVKLRSEQNASAFFEQVICALDRR